MADVRLAFRLIFEKRLPDLERWIVEAGEKDPAKAASLLVQMAEFVVPKLQRHEVSGHEGKAIVFRIEEPTREPT